MNILFTSVGRRVELMQAFSDAAAQLGISLTIHGADISVTAPALNFCDRCHLVPRIKHADYIPTLLKICSEENIRALIPTIDTDLLLLSQHRGEFEKIGTTVVVSDEEKVALCRDKRLTADYFNRVGLESPRPIDDYTAYDMGYPAFIKPKDGSSSIFAYKVENADELRTYAEQVPDYIIQPFIQGVEYTVDVFCDFDGNPIYITPRVRLAVRSGEVLKAEIIQDEQIVEEIKQLVKQYKPRGAITVQLIRQEATGIDYYIEINPRYGGGAPISMKAGANSAKAMLRLLSGERLSFVPDAAANHAVYSRFDQSICINEVERPTMAVVFDLDDTLYSEKDYVRSGYHAVAAVLPQVDNAAKKLWAAFENGLSAIDTVLKDEGIFSEELKTTCLDAYRRHFPCIQLYDGAKELLQALRSKGMKIGIITDGRPEGQRNKIAALGLAALVDEIIVTDELGGPTFRKPCDIAFRIMQKRLGVPFENMLYVGDNIAKDFIAPKQLSMQSVWLKNPDGIYNCADAVWAPSNHIANLRQLLEKI